MFVTADSVENLTAVDENIEDMREDIKEDLKSDDEETRLTALAAGIIDETTARPGNPYAAERSTVGVLTLQCQHINFNNGNASLSYTGKSDVDQDRTIEEDTLVSALKDACEGEGPQTEVLQYEAEDGTKANVNNEQLNNYLDDYGFTAKDIRKWHANELMAETLEDIREDGPNLSEVEDKEETLKEEFNEALETVSEQLGNEANTVQSDYLIDGMKDKWLSNGKAQKKYGTVRKVAYRVASRYLTRRRREL